MCFPEIDHHLPQVVDHPFSASVPCTWTWEHEITRTRSDRYGGVHLSPLTAFKTLAASGISRYCKWAQQDLNLRPSDYESAALTN